MRLCPYCNTEQPEEAFVVYRSSRGKVYYRLRCWRCNAASSKESRKSLRDWFCNYKKTLRCLRCGFADYRALAFHHKDAQDKELEVAEAIRRGYLRECIMEEIAKCVVLCANCHSIAHAEEWLTAKACRAAHARRTKATSPNTAGAETCLLGVRKVCRYCLVEQDESFFEVCKVLGSKVYRRHKCRACKRATQNLRRERLRAWLEARKKTRRCRECGFSDYRALEFHHLDGREKDFAIGEMLKDNRSIAA